MKKATLFLVALMAAPPLMADIFIYVDTATLTTNTAASYGQITLTNTSLPVTNANYSILRTNNVQIGDALPIAFGKINSNFMALTNFLATNSFSGGGGGGASNAIGNLNGSGTNTTFYGTTWLDSSNLSVSQVLGGVSTNYVYFSGGIVFGGTYAWNSASNCYINLAHSSGGASFMYISNNTVFESAGFTYYTNTTTFPGTANSWLGAASPYSLYPGTVTYTNLADTVASGGTLNLTAPFGVEVNGAPIGGVPFTNTTANAGVLSVGGIGTNRPVPYWAQTAAVATNAMTATNDPSGNPLASLLAATNAAAGLFSGAISNWFGNGTNLTLTAVDTNTTTSLTLSTNGNLIYSYYTRTETVLVTELIGISIGGATWTQANGLYVPDQNYFNLNGLPGWTNYNGSAALHTLFGGYVTLISLPGATTEYECTNNFPYAWIAEVQTGPPTGNYAWSSVPILTNVTTRVVVGVGGLLDLGGPQCGLVVAGPVNAIAYFENGAPIQQALQFAGYPYLWVTNAAGLAAGFNGLYGNTGVGFYTNLANGSLIIPPGYYGSAIDGTNFSTSGSLICSNLTSLFQGYSAYNNPSNVTGAYGLTWGLDHMPTNQPLVSVWNPGYLPGLTATNSFQPTNAALSLWAALTPTAYATAMTNSFQPTNANLSLWQVFTPASFGLVSSNSFQPTNANLSLWAAFTPPSYGLILSNSFDATNAAFNALKTATNSFQPTNATLSQFAGVVGGTNSMAFTNKVNTSLSSYWTTNLGTAAIPTNTAPPKYIDYPLTLGSSYTTPGQRGIMFISVICTNGSLVSLSNATSHRQFTVGSVTALGTNLFEASLPCAGGDVIMATNLQPSGITLGTNVWTGW